ncbi:MAG TPA: DUF349 domain-containing protein [Mycobacteriales bacterium]|nr:DUF349 domain-containing protein [Mycobacteriales bacterium]
MTDSEAWGRIADDGTVFVRTADGERVIGSWQAGTAEEGLAYYRRRYDDLAAEVSVLEGRVGAPTVDPRTVEATARKLRESLPEATVIGDLAALERRLDGVLARVADRVAEVAEQRAQAAAAAMAAKEALVEEAERLRDSTDWRATGDRFRAIVEQWKTIRVDRKTDSQLWERFAAARRDFDHRRRAHFADLDRSREEAAERKQRLVIEAEKLTGSTEWGPTARRYKDLMTEWKAAGRAGRGVEDDLWNRFKAAQDTFFSARSEAFKARDDELRANLEAKQALLAEAETLDPSADLEGARKRLRTIHDKWERIGHVPREEMGELERRLGAVEDRVRDAGASRRPVTVTESPLVVRLRESVTKLEARLARAQASGDERLAKETEESLMTQREWLAQAERSGS